MNIKRLIAFFLTVIIAVCCIGCSLNDDSTNGTGDTTTGNQQGTDASAPSGNGGPIVGKSDELLWEKEKLDMTQTDIKLNSKWNECIKIGNVVVSAVNMTDTSAVPNYFYGENSSYADLYSTYYIPRYRLLITKPFEFDIYASAVFEIISTSFGPDDNAEYAYTPVIEELRLISSINPYEGGLDVLEEKAKYDKEHFGIGSDYASAIEIAGEPIDSFTDPMNEEWNITTCVYVADDVEMSLGFMWSAKDNVESSVLTSIDWISTTIATALHGQGNIEYFEDYPIEESPDVDVEPFGPADDIDPTNGHDESNSKTDNNESTENEIGIS